MLEINKFIGLISIIVPVYNMEMFLGKCVESVLKQTYKNFELLLIDDGSTDNSPALCDYYSQVDSRVRVIHKSNGGQGTARNIGIEVSEGDFIAFLDSDDYWHELFLEKMSRLLFSEESDIAICQFQYIDEEEVLLQKRENTGRIENCSGIEAVQYMLYWTKFGVAPWAKLFKKELWRDIRYVEDRIYEDLATTYRVVEHAKRVTYIDMTYMYYRVRKGSDIHRSFEIRKMKTLDTAHDILDYTKVNLPEAYQAAQSRMVATAFFLLMQMNPKEEKYENEQRACIEEIRKLRWNVLKDRNSRKKTRVAAGLSYFGIPVVRYIFKMKKKANPLF